jgi:dynein intermediate chain 1, axonemal
MYQYLKPAGRLLPLWKFVFQKEKKKQVTALCWNPMFGDLFAVGYGSYDFSRQGPGMISCFTLKNPSHPEFIYNTESGVMCLHFHPQVLISKISTLQCLRSVFTTEASLSITSRRKSTRRFTDLETKEDTQIPYGRLVKLTQVCWQKDNLDDNLNFFSVSSDGRITQWTLLKNELLHTDVIALKHDSGVNGDDEKLFSLAGGCCFDFHKKEDHLFVVGTEEGKIYKCSKEYSSQYLLAFEVPSAHIGSSNVCLHGKIQSFPQQLLPVLI